MRLLKQILEQKKGVCETRTHLINISQTAYGCVAHDKLIMPEYPPAHGNCKCKDWLQRPAEEAK